MDKRNKDLDELFKEKLTYERNPYTFSLHDWDVLEQKLKRSEKRRRYHVFLYRAFVGTAAAVLLIFFSIWMIKSNQFISLKPQNTLGIDAIQPENRATTQEPRKEIRNNVQEVYPVESFTSIAKYIDNKTLENKEILETRNKIDENIRVYTIHKVIDSSRQSTGFVNQLIVSQYNKLNSQIKYAEVESNQDINPETIDRKNVVLSIFVAPSINGVRGFKNEKMGGDLGVLFSVDITRKLTLSTGAVYAKKLYEDDFNRTIYPNIGRHAYGGSGSNQTGGESTNISIFPKSVYADCRVLDIPLNINYSLVNKGKNKISIGTGMSSYFMLKEKYQFEYADQNYVNAEKLELVNENRHIMSVLNFQASFNRQLSTKMGISLQPYLKVPLKNIGYAETKLQSAGMAVNINFTLNGKK